MTSAGALWAVPARRVWWPRRSPARLGGVGELHEYTAIEQWTLLQSRETSPTELAAALPRAHSAARPGDRRLRHGDSGCSPRACPSPGGIRSSHSSDLGPAVGDKDLWRRAGVPTGFGSRLFATYVPRTSDAVVRGPRHSRRRESRQDREPRSSAFPPTPRASPPVRHPQPVEHRPRRWRLQRRGGRRRRGRTAAVRPGIRRRRFHPHPRGGLRPRRAQALAGPGAVAERHRLARRPRRRRSHRQDRDGCRPPVRRAGDARRRRAGTSVSPCAHPETGRAVPRRGDARGRADSSSAS